MHSPNIENHMVLPNATEYLDDPWETLHQCANCDADIEDVSEPEVVTILVPRTNRLGKRNFIHEHYCGNACRSKALHRATITAGGKAALARFIIALHLLDDENVASLAPMDRYDLDTFSVQAIDRQMVHTSIAQFRDQASALLNLLSPDDSVDWTNDARCVADRIGEVVGKAVAA